MNNRNPTSKKFGARHWFFQVVPPASILLTLFSTRNGAALVFLVGFFAIPVLISLFSIIFKLVDFKNRKFYLLRPTLMIFLFIAVLAVAQWSYSVALREATDAATLLHEQCNSDQVCPVEPEGWQTDEKRIYRRDLGALFNYSASYYYDPISLVIRVYQGPDMGHVIRGGVDVPFSVDPYVEN